MRSFKIVVTGLILVISDVSAAHAQQQFTQTVTAQNKSCNATCSVIDVPELNGNTSALIFVTPVGQTAQLNPHPVGVYYMYLKKWSVLNLDGTAIPEGAQYGVEYYQAPDANHFAFTVSQGGGMRQPSGACIDRPGLNRNSSAEVKISAASSPSRGGLFNSSGVKLEYDTTSLKWCIATLDGSAVKIDTVYNVGYSASLPSASTPPGSPVGTPVQITPVSTIQTTPPASAGQTPLQGNQIVPTSALVPQLAPLMVIARVEWAIPTVGNVGVLPEDCKVVETAYTNPAILATDTVIVTGQSSNVGLSTPTLYPPGAGQNGSTPFVPINDGKNLRWSASVDNGTVQLTACNKPLQKFQTSNPLAAEVFLNGRKVNILVLR